MQNARNKQKVNVVGAGLVGSLLASYLSRRGFEVHAFERRPDMRKEKISAGRSINLAISVRGLWAVQKLGIEKEVLKIAIPMPGRMIHPLKGDLAFQPYGTGPNDCIHSISRGDLNKILMDHAENSGVSFHFDERALAMDFEQGRVRFKNEKTGIESMQGADFTFATDGAFSAIRGQMAGLPGYSATETPLDHGYKELILPAGPGGSYLLEKNALHIWPRGSYMLIALPNFDGSFTCTLFLPHHGAPSFDSLKTGDQVMAFFEEQFSDIVPLMPRLADEFFGNPTGHMVTVKSFPWNVGGKCLLLGDAAHGIVPFFGQGMNCGFEDCSVLDRYFDENPGRDGTPDWEKLAPHIGKIRKPHTDAIADMAVENFVEMRDKTGNPRFLLEKQVERILSREFHRDYISRYSMVSFSRIPYRTAYDAGLIQSEILSELCSGIQSAEQLDLRKAGDLIRLKLAPFMREKLPV